MQSSVLSAGVITAVLNSKPQKKYVQEKLKIHLQYHVL